MRRGSDNRGIEGERAYVCLGQKWRGGGGEGEKKIWKGKHEEQQTEQSERNSVTESVQ